MTRQETIRRTELLEALRAGRGPIALDGRFEILHEMRRDRLGPVLFAHDGRLGDVLLRLLETEDDGLASLRTLAAQLARVEHPGTLGVLDVGASSVGLFVAYEPFAGVPLPAFARRGLTWSEAREIVASAADALAMLHKHGIAHGDVRPGAILVHALSGRPEVRLTDVGLADLVDGLVPEQARMLPSREDIAYRAFERLGGGRRADTPSDRYSITAVLWEVVFGCPPYADLDPFSMAGLEAQRRGQRSVRRVLAGTPDLSVVFEIGLAHDPNARILDAGELAELVRYARTSATRNVEEQIEALEDLDELEEIEDVPEGADERDEAPGEEDVRALAGAAREQLMSLARQGAIQGRDALIDTAIDFIMNTGTPELDAFERELPDGETDFDALERACRRACEAVIDEVIADVERKAGPVGQGDVDRLERAFAELEGRGILARHTFGATPRDGLERMLEEEAPAAHARGVVVQGYTFCTEQVVEAAAADGLLWLYFGAIDGDRERGIAIGREVLDALGRAGLRARWSGERNDPIDVDMVWARRPALRAGSPHRP